MGVWRAPAAAILVLLDVLGLTRTPHDWVPGSDLRPAGRLLLAATLLLLAYGLFGRRKLAQYAALTLVAFAVAGAPAHPSRLVLLGAVVALLLPYGNGFVVRPDPQRLRAAYATTLIAAFFVLARGMWEAIGRAKPVRQAAFAALPVLPAEPDRSTRMFVAAVLATFLIALGIALAAAPAPPPSGEAERARVRALVQAPGASSLAPFATRADRTYVFSPDGCAALGYRVRFGVALAGGDPVGTPAAAIAAFTDLCAARGWRPAVVGSDARLSDAWRGAGVRRAVEIGDEAILDVATFSLQTRRMRNVRQAVRRAANAGVQVQIGPPRLPELEPVLVDWLHGRGERGFAMNLDAVLVPRPDVCYAVARNADGVAVAFARFAIAAGGRVLSLDVAPRRHDAPNGVVESMIIAMVEHARHTGAAEVTLNFAGMRRVYAGRSLAARSAVLPLRALDRWIELRSLYLFTAKFQPAWRPRQLRMRSWWELIPVGAAALTAEFSTRRPAAAVPASELAEVPAA